MMFFHLDLPEPGARRHWQTDSSRLYPSGRSRLHAIIENRAQFSVAPQRILGLFASFADVAGPRHGERAVPAATSRERHPAFEITLFIPATMDPFELMQALFMGELIMRSGLWSNELPSGWRSRDVREVHLLEGRLVGKPSISTAAWLHSTTRCSFHDNTRIRRGVEEGMETP